MELQWPVDICESCGYNLREATPKAAEKSNDANGRLKWTDFCPKCGRGYFVGDRVEPAPPAEALAEMEAAPIISSGEDKEVKKAKAKVSGIPPDERGAALAKEEENPDPENLVSTNDEVATPATVASSANQEPGAVKPPGKGQFFCTKCAANHHEKSAIGKRHLKYREA